MNLNLNLIEYYAYFTAHSADVLVYFLSLLLRARKLAPRATILFHHPCYAMNSASLSICVDYPLIYLPQLTITLHLFYFYWLLTIRSCATGFSLLFFPREKKIIQGKK